jgi:hypothetical protein
VIKFLNPSVRTEFHLLPLWSQEDLTELSETLEKKGKDLMICQAERVSDKILEIAIRIDEKFNSARSGIEEKPSG